MAIKITKSVINPSHSLIGFIIRGKEKELGGISNAEVERALSIDDMIRSNFSNSQVAVVNNKLIEKNKFKINQLPMLMYNESDYFEVDPTVNLIGRFVQNNENIGFRVRFADGREDNLKYDSLIMLCKWFNPGNFAIRTSSKGRSYICAKQGYGSIDELPATIIGEAPKAKRTKSAAKEKKSQLNGIIDNGFDIIDIYDFIASCDGNVIKLPSEEYKAATVESLSEGAFSSLGIGEVASAKPIFSSSKLNVNAGFKKVGNVKINVNGNEISVPTFTFRTKSMFLNGENYMKKFGIAVPKEKEAELVKKLGGSLALEKIEDLATTVPISQILGNNNLAFYKVDTSKIDLIAPKKREDSIKTNHDLIEMCYNLYRLKLISKATGPKGGIIKEIKDTFGLDFTAKAAGKKVFSSFSMYTKEGLELLQNSGVDIYTGSYTAPYAPGSSSTKSSDSAIEIEYYLSGYNIDKMTGTKIVQAVREGDKTLLPKEVYSVIEKILSIDNYEDRYNEAVRIYNDTEAKIAKLNREFWMHNASMYLNGNKSRVHTHDKEKWIPDTTTRVKKALVYNCIESGCTELCVKLTNISI